MADADLQDHEAATLLERYETVARRELEALDSNMLPELEEAAQLLRRAISAEREVHVGFLGESQVGKSSLINALLGRTALPTGGVGPLTAQATRVRYGDTPHIAVAYHDKRRFNQFLFALRQYLVSRGQLVDTHVTDGDEESKDDPAAAAWAVAVEGNDDRDGGQPSGGIGPYLVDQARLMLGAPDLATSAIHDALRSVIGREPLGDPAAFASLGDRIASLRDTLGGTLELSGDATAAEFAAMLANNAAGWRSPLVAELNIALDVDLLSRVQVVDLPGIGVVGDPGARVGEAFVREEANALVIVARNNGLTDELVRVLERTGIITRMLFGGHVDRPPAVHVVFAITHLDDVAQTRWKQERQRAKESGAVAPTREEVFARLNDEMARKTKEQARRVLEESQQFEDLPQETMSRRHQVVRELCDDMDVLCVSAKDYMNLQSDDEEEVALSFLRREDATNIPRFREMLTKLAARASASRREVVTHALESFRGLLATHVDAIAASAKQQSAPGSAGEAFRSALGGTVPAFRSRATAQRRSVSTYLTESIPPRLETITREAAESTRRRLKRLRKKGESLHWKSLNAALVRNGTWESKGIDYPGELTTGFVEVIAGSWEPQILQEVRRDIRQLVDQQVELVEEFLAEATRLSGDEELLEQISAQKRLLKEQGKSAVTWTAEHLNELSDDVRIKLGAVVAKPIERACTQAVSNGRNQGSGARERILETFEVGGNAAVEKARDMALTLLTDRFRALRASLDRVLRENEDPISQCYDAINRRGADLAEHNSRKSQERLANAIERIRAALEPTGEQPEGPPASRRLAALPELAPVAPMRRAASEIFGDFGGES